MVTRMEYLQKLLDWKDEKSNQGDYRHPALW